MAGIVDDVISFFKGDSEGKKESKSPKKEVRLIVPEETLLKKRKSKLDDALQAAKKGTGK